jgi:hypothetical protein
MTRNKNTKIIAFAADQLIISEYEIVFLKSVHKSENIISKFGLMISTSKIKQWHFGDETPIRSKIITKHKTIKRKNKRIRKRKKCCKQIVKMFTESTRCLTTKQIKTF